MATGGRAAVEGGREWVPRRAGKCGVQRAACGCRQSFFITTLIVSVSLPRHHTQRRVSAVSTAPGASAGRESGSAGGAAQVQARASSRPGAVPPPPARAFRPRRAVRPQAPALGRPNKVLPQVRRCPSTAGFDGFQALSR
eukprot:scaffold21018_cov65-Phaeocystis_antarctica.AAC.3